MSDIILGILLGALMSIVLLAFFKTIDPTSDGNLIKQCEKDLPRSQTCILVAQPKPVAK